MRIIQVIEIQVDVSAHAWHLTPQGSVHPALLYVSKASAQHAPEYIKCEGHTLQPMWQAPVKENECALCML